MHESVIGAAAVHKRWLRLTLRSRHEASGISRGIKYQCSGSRQRVWLQAGGAPGEGHHQGARSLMYVGLNIERASQRQVLQRVPRIPVARVGRQPVVDM